MKFLGFVKMGSNGRILIPKEIRKSYRLESTQVELFCKNLAIYMTISQVPLRGCVRTVDRQGRLNIPVSFREKSSWESQNYIEIYEEQGYFYFQGSQRACAFCEKTDVTMMTSIHSKYICDNCLQTVLGKRYISFSKKLTQKDVIYDAHAEPSI